MVEQVGTSHLSSSGRPAWWNDRLAASPVLSDIRRFKNTSKPSSPILGPSSGYSSVAGSSSALPTHLHLYWGLVSPPSSWGSSSNDNETKDLRSMTAGSSETISTHCHYSASLVDITASYSCTAESGRSTANLTPIPRICDPVFAASTAALTRHRNIETPTVCPTSPPVSWRPAAAATMTDIDAHLGPRSEAQGPAQALTPSPLHHHQELLPPRSSSSPRPSPPRSSSHGPPTSAIAHAARPVVRAATAASPSSRPRESLSLPDGDVSSQGSRQRYPPQPSPAATCFSPREGSEIGTDDLNLLQQSNPAHPRSLYSECSSTGRRHWDNPSQGSSALSSPSLKTAKPQKGSSTPGHRHRHRHRHYAEKKIEEEQGLGEEDGNGEDEDDDDLQEKQQQQQQQQQQRLRAEIQAQALARIEQRKRHEELAARLRARAEVAEGGVSLRDGVIAEQEAALEARAGEAERRRVVAEELRSRVARNEADLRAMEDHVRELEGDRALAAAEALRWRREATRLAEELNDAHEACRGLEDELNQRRDDLSWATAFRRRHEESP